MEEKWLVTINKDYEEYTECFDTEKKASDYYFAELNYRNELNEYTDRDLLTKSYRIYLSKAIKSDSIKY